MYFITIIPLPLEMDKLVKLQTEFDLEELCKGRLANFISRAKSVSKEDVRYVNTLK